jgi:hypothetical protein
MKPIPIQAVLQWKVANNLSIPASIALSCPHCHERVVFTTGNEGIDSARETVAATAHCPACKKQIHLWTIGPTPSNWSSPKPKCIAVFPPAHENRQPIDSIGSLAGPLQQAYLDVIQVYNARVWSATANLCRRTLEGIVLQLSGDSNETNLAKMLRELPKHLDLTKPITSVATSVRLGGNIGSHFSMDIVPDEELATTMLNLLEYLLEYFFTIPEMVEKATKIIDKLPARAVALPAPQTPEQDTPETA